MSEERNPVTQEVIAAASEVYRIMGPGLLDSVCQSRLTFDSARSTFAYSSTSTSPCSKTKINVSVPL
jgi:hypothetical protein